jgi:RNA polymerase sigma factor for flagellar operon FliA
VPSSDDSTPPPPTGTPEELFLANLDLIEKLLAGLARRHHASDEEREEFTSELYLKLITDDYAVFRKFEGTSTLKTYLTTVAANAFLDFREKNWGKWRPSAAAKAMGPVAILMERLIYRDGMSFDQACQILWTNHRVTASVQELIEIWKRLPVRTPRHMEGEDVIQFLPDDGEGPEEQALDREQRARRERVRAVLQKALQELPAEDRLIVKLVVLESVKIVTVARILKTEQKPLYRRIEKILKTLRRALEREGVRWKQLADLFNRPLP